MNPPSKPRDRLLQILKEEPGLHFRAIQRKSGMALGQLEYHLYKLVKEEEIVERKDGRFKRYFLSVSANSERKLLGFHLRSKTSRSIIMLLLRKGSMDRENILRKLGSGDDIGNSLRSLISDRIVIDSQNTISLRNPDSVKDFIKNSRKSFLEELTDSFIDLLDEE
ncbi:MAG: hypothetical protein ACYCSO_03060 [Cuniculiplasma sp.]